MIALGILDIVKQLALVGGLSMISIILVVSISALIKKFGVVAPLIVVGTLFLLLPIILWNKGLFEEKKLFANSDTLGYYGAVIGGGVTVLGILWTFNYESKKSKEERRKERKKLKEERRKDSLPILRFTFNPEHISTVDSDIFEPETDTKGIPFYFYDIYIYTRRGASSIQKDPENSFIEFGTLIIDNEGLGAAVLSDVYLKRNNKGNVCANLNRHPLDRIFVAPGKSTELKMCIISDDFNIGDELKCHFTDLYLNEYCYTIPFKNMELEVSDYKTAINPNNVKALPRLVGRVD